MNNPTWNKVINKLVNTINLIEKIEKHDFTKPKNRLHELQIRTIENSRFYKERNRQRIKEMEHKPRPRIHYSRANEVLQTEEQRLIKNNQAFNKYRKK